MRLFVAVSLPAGERRRVHEAAGDLRDRGLPVRWVRPEHYHLTMKFLGDVEERRLDPVRDAVEKAALGNDPFDLPFGDFGAFPSIRQPRVLWLGLEASPELRCLKEDLEWALADCGFERDGRAFHPHLTLGRVKRKGAAGPFRDLDEIMAGMECGGRISVDELDLIQSRLSPEGPHYSVVSSSRLGAGA